MRSIISVLALSACFSMLTACGGSKSSTPVDEVADNPTILSCQDANQDGACDNAASDGYTTGAGQSYGDIYGAGTNPYQNGCQCPAGFVLVNHQSRSHLGTYDVDPRCIREADMEYSVGMISMTYKKRPGKDDKLIVDAQYDQINEDFKETLTPSGCSAVVTCNPLDRFSCGGNNHCSTISGRGYGACRSKNSIFN